MSSFDDWWRQVYLDKPKEIYRQCYEEGYQQGRAELLGSILTVSCAVATSVFVTALILNYVL